MKLFTKELEQSGRFPNLSYVYWDERLTSVVPLPHLFHSLLSWQAVDELHYEGDEPIVCHKVVNILLVSLLQFYLKLISRISMFPLRGHVEYVSVILC